MILGKLLLLHLIDIKKASVTPKPLHCTNYISMTALYHLDSDLNILYEIHFHMIFFQIVMPLLVEKTSLTFTKHVFTRFLLRHK